MRKILTVTLIFVLVTFLGSACSASERSEYKLWEVNTSGGASRMQEISAHLNSTNADGWKVVAAHAPFNGWAIFTFRRTSERFEYKLWEARTSGGASRMQEIAAHLNRSNADGWEVVTAHAPFDGWVIYTFRR